MLRSQAKQVLKFLNGVPELGTRAMLVQHEILLPKVLALEDIRPKTLLPRVDPPDPFDQKTGIHEARVSNAHPPKALRRAHRRPPYPVILAFGTVGFPIEAGTVAV
jgi:hypothetical protein